MIVSPPKLVGVDAIARLFGIAPHRVRVNVRAAAPYILRGYIGKIGGRHVWNLHETIASTFTSAAALEQVVDRLTDGSDEPDVACGVTGCDQPEQLVGLCTLHLRRLMTAFRRAPRSSLVLVQLVAMCRWVTERNAHLVLEPGFDPWATVCMRPDCDNPTNTEGQHGPLCAECAAAFWNNPLLRPRPNWWKRTRERIPA